MLYGFRYADLEEDLRINDANLALVDLGPGLPAGSQLRTFDLFDTRNRFYGGQAGLRWEGRRGPVTIRLVGKLALGATHQNVRVDGRTIRIDASGGAIFGHGKLAHGTNIGEYSRDQFSVIPEVGTYVGYDILEGLSIYAGYTFLYWTNVVRPGDQIDTGLNNSQRFGGTLVGEPRPAFDFHETDFWAHGLSLGASLTF